MQLDIRWKILRGDRDPGWNQKQVLYAYLSPDEKEVLYIGKAVDSSVRDRWNHAARKGFWEGLENQRGIASHHVIVGELHSPAGVQPTEELLSDIETLLVNRIAPWGNLDPAESRIAQEELCIRCTGGWNGWKPEYVHPG